MVWFTITLCWVWRFCLSVAVKVTVFAPAAIKARSISALKSPVSTDRGYFGPSARVCWLPPLREYVNELIPTGSETVPRMLTHCCGTPFWPKFWTSPYQRSITGEIDGGASPASVGEIGAARLKE